MTSKEALKFLESRTNFSSDEDIDKDLYDLEGNIACRTIKRDLKFLEIIKEYFYIKFNNHNWGNYITIVGKEDFDILEGVDKTAMSDFVEDEETEFLKEYLDTINNKENK